MTIVWNIKNGCLADLHTHISGQVSAEDLLEIGRIYGALYPTAAFDKFGIDYPKNRLETIPKRQLIEFLLIKRIIAITDSYKQ